MVEKADGYYSTITDRIMERAEQSEKTLEKDIEAENLAKEIISKLNEGKTFDEVKEEYKDKITYEELGYKAEYLGKDITDEVKIESNLNTTKIGEYEIF